MHEVYLVRAAERDLKRLSTKDFQQLIAAIKALAQNPRPPGCRKITGSRNNWRIKVGNRRIIYEIDDTAMAVRVMRIRHRREAYR